MRAFSEGVSGPAAVDPRELSQWGYAIAGSKRIMSLLRASNIRLGVIERMRSRRHCASSIGTFQFALRSRTSIDGCILPGGIARRPDPVGLIFGGAIGIDVSVDCVSIHFAIERNRPFRRRSGVQ